MKTIFIFLLAFLLRCFAHAQVYVMQGTIGPYPIVMKIDCSGNTVSGTYFYNSSLKDITFDGERLGPLYVLYKTATNEKTGKTDTTELFVLHENDNKTWSGGWKGGKGKKYDVALTSAEMGKHRNEDMYTFARKSLFTKTADSTVKKGKYTLEYYHIGKSPVYSFRVTEGLAKNTAAKVNNLLAFDAGEQADAYFSCTAQDAEPDYDYSITNTFLTDNVISVVTFIAYYCGGAHPDDYEHSININARTGELLELEDVLHLTNVKKPPKESDKWIDYRSDEYIPKLMALLSSLYPAKMVADTTGASCDYTNADYWNFPDWYFSAAGLYVRPSFPHVVAECSDPDWSTIPYDILKKYKNPAKNISLP